ncbi:hypothetical protein [Merismopedia glauca]|uniref:Uncharacterized protein n=1 Tax=Merismopedia glauca CCAP 1448/3 TaxID=1296344 RepID=A0A2T1BY33_9CYAN|nr:hypothetical protein [Merismopedia glauca]PSB00912.1 hypothetical protein C7B64_21080 [Merismopedia glauca CCAP 1448/3]
MKSEPTNPESVRIAIRQEQLSQLAKIMSGEACWLLLALVSKLKRNGMIIAASLNEIIEEYPTDIDDINKGLDELKKNDVIKEIKSDSGLSYSINYQVLPTIFIDI